MGPTKETHLSIPYLIYILLMLMISMLAGSCIPSKGDAASVLMPVSAKAILWIRQLILTGSSSTALLLLPPKGKSTCGAGPSNPPPTTETVHDRRTEGRFRSKPPSQLNLPPMPVLAEWSGPQGAPGGGGGVGPKYVCTGPNGANVKSFFLFFF